MKKEYIILICIILIIITLLMGRSKNTSNKTTLAEQTNNPLNLLQLNPSAWKGLKGKRTNGLLIFESLFYGIRAGFINLIQKVNSGKNTIEQIFQDYGDPGHEETYKNFVSSYTGIPRSKKLQSPDEIKKIGKAVIKMESGKDWVNDTDIESGLSAALNSYKLMA